MAPEVNRIQILKKYGMPSGTRFAAVVIDGHRLDVRIRGSKDGRIANEWGDFYPFYEDRAKQIKDKALERYNAGGK